jgi:hypothetical protein
VLRQCHNLLLMGRLLLLTQRVLGRLVSLQLCDLGLQYYTRKVDGM